MYNVVVIGAGVAGLFAGGLLAQKGRKVVVLEKMEKPARKLRITGKGRCNITNTKTKSEFLERVHSGREFIEMAFDGFTNSDAIEFFNSIGLPTAQERGGRIFPQSGSAVEAANVMVEWAQSKGAEIRCKSEVESLIKSDEGFELKLKDGQSLTAEAVVVATGGVSYPLTGSTGDGYYFAHDFGHTIVPVLPSLVALRIDEVVDDVELRNVEIRLVVDSAVVDSRFGDVDFSSRGIGGGAALQLSRAAVEAVADRRMVEVELDMKSALSLDKLVARLRREIDALEGKITVKELLRKILPREMVGAVLSRIEAGGKRVLGEMSDLQSNRTVLAIAKTVKNLRFEIVDYGDFTQAIITNGGVSLEQINPLTMESTLCAGLYFVGEVLDMDADTGGYNIQLALSSAHAAAKSL